MGEFRVPTYKKNQGLQTIETPVTPIGAAKSGAALTGAFRVAEDVADLVAAREAQRKDENDKINASNLYYGPGGFKDKMRQVSTTARSTVGEASKNIGSDSIEAYNKAGEELLNSDLVENDEQKLMLQGLVFKGRSSFIAPIATHDARQHQLRKTAAQEQVVVDATMSVTEDPASLNDSLVDLRLALDGQPERLAKEEEALKKIAEEAALKNLSDATWNLAMTLSLEDGESVIKASELPRENKKKMLKDFRDEKTIQENRDDDELKQAQQATANEFDQKLDTLNIAEVENSNLEPGISWGEKGFYRNKISDRAKNIATQKVDAAKKAQTEKKALEKELAKEKLSDTQSDFLKRIDDLKADEVQGSNLPAFGTGSKDTFLKAIAKRDEVAEIKDPHNEFDPATFAGFQKQANIDPNSLTNDMLWGAVGKGKDGGITSAQAQSLQATRDKNRTNTDQGKRNGQAFTVLDRVERGKIYSDDAFENALKGQEWDDALQKAIDDNEGNESFDPVKWVEDKKVIMERDWLDNLLIRIGGDAEQLPAGFKEVDPKRQQAIDILNQNKKAVNEQTIKAVMGQL